MRISDWSSDVCSSDLGTVARMTLAQTTTTAAPDGGASGLADLLAATLPTESRLVVAWSDVRIDGGLPHTGNAPHALIARARGCLEHFVPDTADAEIVDAWHDTGTRIALAARLTQPLAPGSRLAWLELADRKSTRLNSSH